MGDEQQIELGDVSDDLANSLAKDIVQGLSDGKPVQNLLNEKLKQHMDERLEGNLLEIMKHNTGEDLIDVVTNYNTWMLGVLLVAVGCTAGGIIESFAVRSRVHGIVPDDRRRRIWMALVLSIDALFFIWSSLKVSLNIATPCIALHQVSRMITEVFRGKGSGGGRMKIGVVLICVGLVVTTLFGVHNDPIKYSWGVISDALFLMPFQVWITLNTVVIAVTSVVALVLSDSDTNSTIMIDSPTTGNYTDRLYWLCGSYRRAPVCQMIMSIKVSSATKRVALASASGVLASYLLVIVQRLLLLDTSDGLHINIFYTVVLSIAVAVYFFYLTFLLNAALHKFETSSFLPLMMASTIMVACITDMLLLECLGDLNFNILRIIVYSGGNVTVCSGLLLMGRADVRRQIEDLQIVAEEVSRMAKLFDQVEGELAVESHNDTPMTVVHGSPNPNDLDLGNRYDWLYLDVDKDENSPNTDGDFVKSILDDMRIPDVTGDAPPKDSKGRPLSMPSNILHS